MTMMMGTVMMGIGVGGRVMEKERRLVMTKIWMTMTRKGRKRF
jgi:hypothetical protein